MLLLVDWKLLLLNQKIECAFLDDSPSFYTLIRLASYGSLGARVRRDRRAMPFLSPLSVWLADHALRNQNSAQLSKP